jgi:hypothetical protein
VSQHEANRPIQKRKLRVDPVQFPLELVKFRYEELVLDHNRPHDTEVPAAMPADESLVLDRFCAERAFHQAAIRSMAD